MHNPVLQHKPIPPPRLDAAADWLSKNFEFLQFAYGAEGPDWQQLQNMLGRACPAISESDAKALWARELRARSRRPALRAVS